MNEDILKALEKISDTLCVVSGNLLCPSYHGTVKYNRVNKQLSEMRASIKELRDKIND